MIYFIFITLKVLLKKLGLHANIQYIIHLKKNDLARIYDLFAKSNKQVLIKNSTIIQAETRIPQRNNIFWRSDTFKYRVCDRLLKIKYKKPFFLLSITLFCPFQTLYLHLLRTVTCELFCGFLEMKAPSNQVASQQVGLSRLHQKSQHYEGTIPAR